MHRIKSSISDADLKKMIDEYVACRRGTFAVGIQYLSAITCETDLESLAAPGKVSACAGPFARCPEYAAAFQ